MEKAFLQTHSLSKSSQDIFRQLFPSYSMAWEGALIRMGVWRLFSCLYFALIAVVLGRFSSVKWGVGLNSLQGPFPREVCLNQWVTGSYGHSVFICYIALFNYSSVHLFYILRQMALVRKLIILSHPILLKLAFFNHKDIWKACPMDYISTLVFFFFF